MPRRPRPHFALALLWALATAPAHADTVTLNPSADTCLFEFLPSFNWGAEPELVAGVLNTPAGGNDRCRILMKFDIDGIIPAGATITSAALTMAAVKSPSSPQDGNFQLLRMLVPWLEGSKVGASNPGGALATTGETTWSRRSHPDVEWESPGGKLEFDFAEDASASILVSGKPNPGPDSYVLNFNTDGIADLNSMLNFPGSNFGWVFLCQNEILLKSARRWTSREHPTDAPSLEITFTPPPPPALFEITDAELDPTSGDLMIQFNSIAGEDYAFDYRTDLSTGDWTEGADSIFASGTSTSFTFQPPAGTQRLFFRVRETAP